MHFSYCCLQFMFCTQVQCPKVHNQIICPLQQNCSIIISIIVWFMMTLSAVTCINVLKIYDIPITSEWHHTYFIWMHESMPHGYFLHFTWCHNFTQINMNPSSVGMYGNWKVYIDKYINRSFSERDIWKTKLLYNMQFYKWKTI